MSLGESGCGLRAPIKVAVSPAHHVSPLNLCFFLLSALCIDCSLAAGPQLADFSSSLAFVSSTGHKIPRIRLDRISTLKGRTRRMVGAAAARQSSSTNARATFQTRTRPKEYVWSTRYSDLVAYQSKYGDTNVPLSYHDTKLAIWVRNQRHQYRHLINGRYSSLTEERIRKLKEMNFNFGIPPEVAWKRRYEQLVEYRDTYGDCNVPELWEENVALGRWVVAQRVQYRNLQAGMKPGLTEERVDALNSIGFEWDILGRQWSEMLERTRGVLVSIAAAAEDGVDDDGDVDGSDDYEDDIVSRKSRNSNISLLFSKLRDESINDVRVWIRVQRHQYARLQRGESSQLTPERIQRLEELPGFAWIGTRGRRSEASKKSGPSTKDWSKLFEEIKEVDNEAAPIAEDRKKINDDWDEDNLEDLEDLWAMEDDD